jgi:hypothetical protein
VAIECWLGLRGRDAVFNPQLSIWAGSKEPSAFIDYDSARVSNLTLQGRNSCSSVFVAPLVKQEQQKEPW